MQRHVIWLFSWVSFELDPSSFSLYFSILVTATLLFEASENLFEKETWQMRWQLINIRYILWGGFGLTKTFFYQIKINSGVWKCEEQYKIVPFLMRDIYKLIRVFCLHLKMSKVRSIISFLYERSSPAIYWNNLFVFRTCAQVTHSVVRSLPSHKVTLALSPPVSNSNLIKMNLGYNYSSHCCV